MKNLTKNKFMAKHIQSLTGATLVKINYDANQFVEMGLCESREEALRYMLEILRDKQAARITLNKGEVK
jgi:hypothetical protein